MSELNKLFGSIRACTLCQQHLPHGANPVIRGSETSQLMIIGQAPGIRVHDTSIPWNDPSGDRLRDWLQLDKEAFYNESHIAIMPMGFCYPGTGKSGDLPPRKECAPTWHQAVTELMPSRKLTLLIGKYAQDYYLEDSFKTLTENVKHWEKWFPTFIPLPHPSPRNNIWLKRNPWFEQSLLPELRNAIQEVSASLKKTASIVDTDGLNNQG